MPKVRHISQDAFKKIMDEFGVEYKGVTKSGEPRLMNMGKEFTTSRKTDKGYKAESIKKIIDIIKLEKSANEGISPGEAYDILIKKARQIIGADF